MDDMRQKLFPIFLKEADHNLQALREFLAHKDLRGASEEALETAFRAAHTLKGTATLVDAESICKISRRLEALLEKHFSAQTMPTPVEHEAMKLAVDWIAPLVSALRGNCQEPKLFVSEAIQALDLAEAFPGRTPLVELLDSNSEQRAPQLDDPFSADPEFLQEAEAVLRAGQDPFADDPDFGVELDLASPEPVLGSDNPEIDDPFAGDHDFVAEQPLAVSSQTQLEEEEDAIVDEPAAALPYDPFAEDSLGLDIDSVPMAEQKDLTIAEDLPAADANDAKTAVEEVDAETVASAALVDDPFAEDDSFDEGLVVSSTVVAAAALDAAATVTEVEDPFAEDDNFDAEFTVTSTVTEDDAVEAEADPFVATTEEVATKASEIAESLLLPQDETAPRRDYTCCVFAIGGRDYHLPIKQMQEISDLPEILPLPLAPPMVSGLINLRGQVMPVINLAILNQHQQSEVRIQRRLVIAEYQGEPLAFLADGVPYLAEDFSGEKVDMAKFLSLYRIRGLEE